MEFGEGGEGGKGGGVGVEYLRDNGDNDGLNTGLHSERPKLYTILAFLSAIGLIVTVLQYSLQPSDTNNRTE